MIETALITFREGLEAFLIVAIMLAYIKNTGHTKLIKPVYAGIVTALIISATTGWHVAELAGEPVWEGSLAMAAGVMVASFTIYVMRTAKNIRGDIHKRIDTNAQKDSMGAMIGVFVFTVLMIAREGMETALMLGTLSGESAPSTIIAGACVGLIAVALIGYLWAKQSNHINLRLFLQVTGAFLVLFSVHLFVYGLHELTETESMPFISRDTQIQFHILTEPLDGGEPLGNFITYSLLAVPCLWLFLNYVRVKLFTPTVCQETAE